MDLLNALKKLVPILAYHKYIGTDVYVISLYRYVPYRYCCYGIMCSGFSPVHPVLGMQILRMPCWNKCPL